MTAPSLQPMNTAPAMIMPSVPPPPFADVSDLFRTHVIEPAEPETPPAHSLGKVLWRGTGGEGGGKTCFFIAFFIWRGWWLDLFFHRFFDIFGRLGQEKSTEIAAKVQIDEKTEK